MTPEEVKNIDDRFEALAKVDEATRNTMLAMIHAINAQASVIDSLITALKDADIEVHLPDTVETEQK